MERPLMPEIKAFGPVVLVDDDEMEHFLFKKYAQLVSLEREFSPFDSGQSFLEYMDGVESGREPEPAVVVLDVRMPCMDGFKVLKNIRSKHRFKNIPIMIMFSNSEDPSDAKKALELGADAYHTKPTGKQDYVQFLNALFPETAE